MPKNALDIDMDVDDNPRPAKRARPTELETDEPLDPASLLLNLPALLAHPPAHKLHRTSLHLAFTALKRSLGLEAFPDAPNARVELTAQEECRAWTTLAEVGVQIGLEEEGIAKIVEDAVNNAVLIAQKQPSLYFALPNLTRLSADLAIRRGNVRFAQNLLKRQIASPTTSKTPSLLYATHLNYIASLGSAADIDVSSSTPTSSPTKPGVKQPYTPHTANFKVFTAIRDFYTLAERNGHQDIVKFGKVMELREYVCSGFWAKVQPALLAVEDLLGMDLPSQEPEENSQPTGSTLVSTKEKAPKSAIHICLEIHTLVIGVVFYTHLGRSLDAQARLKKMHDYLDGGALEAFGHYGLVEIPLPDSPSLTVQVMHPRIAFTLGFLVSATAKRDPVGRKPKRKLFANEGISLVEKELRKEIQLPIWSSVADLEEHRQTLFQLKADLLCEVVGACITRSEFSDAERALASLIAHTRTYDLFSIYSPRIALHHAHLAHAKGNVERAKKCYALAAHLSRSRSLDEEECNPEDDDGVEDLWINASARLGDVWLRVGLVAQQMVDQYSSASASTSSFSPSTMSVDIVPNPEVDCPDLEGEMERLREVGAVVIKDCAGLGGTLGAAAAVLEACLAKEFLKTKSHLKTALELSTDSHDNYARALVLSLIAAQYVHTSVDHAQDVLKTAEQLALGLGAVPVKKPNAHVHVADGKENNRQQQPKAQLSKETQGLGNVPLRLWIGEQTLDLKKRVGDEKGAERQTKINDRLREIIVSWRTTPLDQRPVV